MMSVMIGPEPTSVNIPAVAAAEEAEACTG